MDVIVITGVPGVGKTALLFPLSDALAGKIARLDGDDVGRTKPIQRTRERLDLIQDNICACANNFASWGARYFLICFVLPTQERLDRMVGLLHRAGYRVWVVALVADEDVLLERHKQKGDWAAVSDYLGEAVGCNRAIRELQGVTFVDTTNMGVQKIVNKLALYANTEDPFS